MLYLEEVKNKGYAKFWAANKVYDGSYMCKWRIDSC